MTYSNEEIKRILKERSHSERVANNGNIHELNGHTREIERALLTPFVEFINSLVMPEYLIDGVLQRGYVYSLTAAPGAGKTALALMMSICISRGLPFGTRCVDQGSVVYFAGENPDDVKARCHAQCQHMGVDPQSIDNISFVGGAYKLSEIGGRIKKETEESSVALVIVDTLTVFFEGKDENSNTEMQEHAIRIRETLGSLNGHPTIIVLAHPPKNASADNPSPRGGGSFIGSMDGNLINRRTDNALEFHHDPQKFRGPGFEPMNFQLKSVTHERLVTKKGTLIPTVVCLPLSDEDVEGIHAAVLSDQDALLVSLRNDRKMTTRERASRLGWTNQKGEPNHTKVMRRLKGLEKDGLVGFYRGSWGLTKKGAEEAKKVYGFDNGESEEKCQSNQ